MTANLESFHRVLVVDDSAVDRRLAGGLLEKTGSLRVSYASDGAEGLRAVEESSPDLVLTDLKMPGMTGLELVQEIRSRFPSIPVVLMTADGSEDVAIQALLFGAASYVPKVRLAKDLADTVEHVLTVSGAERRHDRVLQCVLNNRCELELENDPSLIPPLIDFLQRGFTRLLDCDETARIRVGVALEEALLNALYHGNLEISSQLREEDDGAYYRTARQRALAPPYATRRIRVAVDVDRQVARYMICDEGPGYDVTALADPTDPANLHRPCGRGLLLIRSFMDEVRHNSQGNEITMVKRAQFSSAADSV